jgi:hypothetical protein
MSLSPAICACAGAAAASPHTAATATAADESRPRRRGKRFSNTGFMRSNICFKTDWSKTEATKQAKKKPAA